jgi:HK97 family phage major capsid protein
MSGTVSVRFLTRLEAQRSAVLAESEAWLRSLGEGTLSPGDEARYRNYSETLRGLATSIRETRSELERMGSYSLKGTGNRACPLRFDMEELRSLHQKVLRGESGRIEARDFASPVDLIPAQLYPQPLFPIHDNRVMDRWPNLATDAPSVEYIRVDSVTGDAEIVAEGALKPELLMPATPQTVTAQKIAAHVGLSWEATQDWSAFVSAVQTELTNKIIDTENRELLLGDGTTGHLDGLLTTTGILTHPVSGPDSPIDHIEEAISELRVGSALAEPDLAIFHPSTWSAIRRTKDTLDRYIVAADPSKTEVNTVWGVNVLVTTQLTAGIGVLMDTSKFGRVHVREPIGVRVGFANDDFVKNIVRYVAEERIALAVERPAAVCKLTGLPTALATKSTAKK